MGNGTLQIVYCYTWRGMGEVTPGGIALFPSIVSSSSRKPLFHSDSYLAT
ncbi:hypothetical protein A2U01_0081193, partial [Trifolium medium]|nr:hypothetical protein [Trifolium medium]